jgi:hypothetical protein
VRLPVLAGVPAGVPCAERDGVGEVVIDSEAVAVSELVSVALALAVALAVALALRV